MKGIFESFIVWVLQFKWVRKIVAKVMLTFISDCPHCHKHFLGRHHYREQVRIGNTHYRIICHRCAHQLEHKT